MGEYRVTWTIEVDADNEQDAAIRAWQIQHDADSEATFFIVEPFPPVGTHIGVDLANHPDF